MMNLPDQIAAEPPAEREARQYRLWASTRDRLLGQIDDLERYLEINPRTSQIRAWYRIQVEKISSGEKDP